MYIFFSAITRVSVLTIVSRHITSLCTITSKNNNESFTVFVKDRGHHSQKYWHNNFLACFSGKLNSSLEEILNKIKAQTLKYKLSCVKTGMKGRARIRKHGSGGLFRKTAFSKNFNFDITKKVGN